VMSRGRRDLLRYFRQETSRLAPSFLAQNVVRFRPARCFKSGRGKWRTDCAIVIFSPRMKKSVPERNHNRFTW